MARPKINKECEECGEVHYAKGLCKRHYMAANKDRFNPSINTNIKSPQLDRDGFWEFVKKELNIV
jgi:hypothetical protein